MSVSVPAKPVVRAAASHSGEALTARLSIDGRTESLPFYASEAFRTEAAKGGTRYFLAIGSLVRLTQFGNRQSSKQRQNAYALRMAGVARVKLRIDVGTGKYGDDCQLCFQIYDSKHQFLTQLRIPLRPGAKEHEHDLPADAVLGCFSVQLSGSGKMSDIAVEIAPAQRRLGQSLGFEPSIRSPADLTTLLEARDETALRDAALGQPEIVVAALWRWFGDRRYHDVFQLLAVARNWRCRPGFDPIYAYLLFFSARCLANLNATQSALTALKELYGFEGWKALLEPKDAQGALILHGQLLIRNGRPDDGVDALDVARMNEPTHWEAYFLLANNLGDDHAELKDAYYDAASALLGRPHAKLAVATVENHLRRGRWPDALVKALEGIAGLKPGHDVWLALANLYLDRGDDRSWRHFMGSYFEQFGLTPPLLVPDPETGGLRNALVPASPERRAGGAGVVAVVMTTYNSEGTLELAARSVLDQTYGDLTLAIVDDCSSDRTREIAATLAASDSRVRLFVSEANSGTYICKNIALAKVEADYYTFHDSDDWMHPQRIEKHLSVMKDTGAACTTSVWFRMGVDGRVNPRHAGGYQHANPASIFVRRDVIESIGYFDSVRTGADTEYVWRIRNRYGHANTIEIALPLAVGLHHEASLTQSGVAAFNRHRYSEVRLDYWESWVRWHIETLARDPGELRLAFPLDERRFAAPRAITPEGGRAV